MEFQKMREGSIGIYSPSSLRLSILLRHGYRCSPDSTPDWIRFLSIHPISVQNHSPPMGVNGASPIPSLFRLPAPSIPSLVQRRRIILYGGSLYCGNPNMGRFAETNPWIKLRVRPEVRRMEDVRYQVLDEKEWHLCSRIGHHCDPGTSTLCFFWIAQARDWTEHLRERSCGGGSKKQRRLCRQYFGLSSCVVHLVFLCAMNLLVARLRVPESGLFLSPDNKELESQCPGLPITMPPMAIPASCSINLPQNEL
ncbi:hypothetical protein BDV25DRAFT_122138 [Aspergillus avenaceus]|uniref:Uncharacterized protein n=1 Tax=Aspergillus avenaceus TaxID=36643 RepID=A0A5N6TU48_ASPAV|nr:hypothetical protein BDV25DRAFT_122138 [Aspergillus avenaceus]